MDWILIDSHESGRVRVGWCDGAAVRWRTHTGRSHRVLNDVACLIEERKKQPDGCAVVSGPGSFSAVRIGVLQANILARMLQIPLVALTVGECMSVKGVLQILKQKSRRVRYAEPMYDAEPNITKTVALTPVEVPQ